MKVLITVDTEISPMEISPDNVLRANIEQRIYGCTKRGNVGIGYKARTLRDLDLTGVFFVEGLCGSVIDSRLLNDWVHLLQSQHHEVQLHVHSEWGSHLDIEPQSGLSGQNLSHFKYDDQYRMIGMALENLARAGAKNICALRAGNYGANDDTVRVAAAHGLRFDSSYNESYLGKTCQLSATKQPNRPDLREGCWELPITNFEDGFGNLRHAQLCACSASELIEALTAALAQNFPSFVIVSHSFELLGPSRKRASYVNKARWLSLLSFLQNNRDGFKVVGFQDIETKNIDKEVTNDKIQVSMTPTIKRYCGQLINQMY